MKKTMKKTMKKNNEKTMKKPRNLQKYLLHAYENLLLEVGRFYEEDITNLSADDQDIVYVVYTTGNINNTIDYSDTVQVCIGNYYLYRPVNGPSNYPEAQKWFLKAINKGNTNALCHLAYMCRNGNMNRVDNGLSDLREAIELYERAVGKGNAHAMKELAEIYKYGEEEEGFDSDYQKEIELYERAVDAGESYAMLSLGDIYNKGFDTIGMNKVKAIELYEKSTRQGNYEQSRRPPTRNGSSIPEVFVEGGT